MSTLDVAMEGTCGNSSRGSSPGGDDSGPYIITGRALPEYKAASGPSDKGFGRQGVGLTCGTARGHSVLQMHMSPEDPLI